MAHISTYYFCRTFKQMTGKTTTEYINEVRLKRSIKLLKDGNMNITEISINCGFNDVNYFSRLFKKSYGVSPTKFIY
nr:helix-turn-helix transcriptional regulator [Clostridium sporogenes]